MANHSGNSPKKPRTKITLEQLDIDGDAADALAMLGTTSAVACVGDRRARILAAIRHLIASAADGVLRPGSWERGWLIQAFGDIDTEPHRDGVSYHEQPVDRIGR